MFTTIRAARAAATSSFLGGLVTGAAALAAPLIATVLDTKDRIRRRDRQIEELQEKYDDLMGRLNESCRWDIRDQSEHDLRERLAETIFARQQQEKKDRAVQKIEDALRAATSGNGKREADEASL